MTTVLMLLVALSHSPPCAPGDCPENPIFVPVLENGSIATPEDDAEPAEARPLPDGDYLAQTSRIPDA